MSIPMRSDGAPMFMQQTVVGRSPCSHRDKVYTGDPDAHRISGLASSAWVGLTTTRPDDRASLRPLSAQATSRPAAPAPPRDCQIRPRFIEIPADFGGDHLNTSWLVAWMADRIYCCLARGLQQLSVSHRHVVAAIRRHPV